MAIPALPWRSNFGIFVRIEDFPSVRYWHGIFEQHYVACVLRPKTWLKQIDYLLHRVFPIVSSVEIGKIEIVVRRINILAQDEFYSVFDAEDIWSGNK